MALQAQDLHFNRHGTYGAYAQFELASPHFAQSADVILEVEGQLKSSYSQGIAKSLQANPAVFIQC